MEFNFENYLVSRRLVVLTPLAIVLLGLGAILFPGVLLLVTFTFLGLSSLLLLGGSDVSLLLLEVLVVEKIDEGVKLLVSALETGEDSDFLGEQPHDHRDRLGASVVAWDGNIDKLEVRVGVAEGDDGDVHVRGFNDGLSVCVWVDNNEHSWLLELLGLVVSEHTRGPSGVRGSLASGGLSELNDGSLSEVSGGDSLELAFRGLTRTSSLLGTPAIILAASLSLL